MTNTDIEQLGTAILAAHGLPTHVVVLSPWQPAIDRMRAHDQEARRIARMWQEAYAEAVWNVLTREVEQV